MSKKMLITYTNLSEIPAGRSLENDLIVYSGTVCRGLYGKIGEQTNITDKKTLVLMEQLAEDLAEVLDVYVYVGLNAIQNAAELINDLQERGKVAHMIACSCCELKTKKELARELGIDLKLSQCGGQKICCKLIEDHRSITTKTTN